MFTPAPKIPLPTPSIASSPVGFPIEAEYRPRAPALTVVGLMLAYLYVCDCRMLLLCVLYMLCVVILVVIVCYLFPPTVLQDELLLLRDEVGLLCCS